MNNTAVVIATASDLFARILQEKMTDNGMYTYAAVGEYDLNEKIRKMKPKYVFIENCFSGLITDTLIKRIAKENRNVRIVVWAAYEVKPRIAARFIEAGADSFFSLRDNERDIDNIIRMIASGRQYYSDEVKICFDKDIHYSGTELTNREIEIIKMSASGKSNRKIGELLSVSINTVKTHKKHIYYKCGGNTILDILRNGLTRGIICFDDLM